MSIKKRIGVVGFGFMGRAHFKHYQKMTDAGVVAICDIVKDKLSGHYSPLGNQNKTGQDLDLTGIALFQDAERMFKETDLDAVSITLPTHLHMKYTLMALQAGLHVLCEKPMALSSADCWTMVEAAETSGYILQVGHCIRFWPEYIKARELIDSGDYGAVKSAFFRRLSLTPRWVCDNWFLDENRSGGGLLDLHIHDADFVQSVWGMPQSVFTRAVIGPSGGYDHATTQYFFDDDKIIAAEGGWMMADSFGFRMSFDIIFEKAVVCYDSRSKPTLQIYPEVGEPFTPAITGGDGYSQQLAHFIRAVSGESVNEIATPRQSWQTLVLMEAEKLSAKTSQKVLLKAK